MKLKTNVVTWFEIYVEDIDRAKKFYSQVLALEMENMSTPDNMNDFRMVSFPWVENAPNANGALVKAKGVKSGGNSTIVYFTCSDYSQEENRVVPSGGKVLKPKFSIGEYGFCSICEDTEGNTFGLHSMK